MLLTFSLYREIKYRSEEISQCERILCTPGNTPFRIQSLKIAYQEHAKVDAGSQSRPSHCRSVEFSSNFFDKIVKSVFRQDGIETAVEWMCRCIRYLISWDPKEYLMFAFSFSDCHGGILQANNTSNNMIYPIYGRFSTFTTG